MTAANQAKDRKTKPKTDRQQMAAEAVNEASMNISMSGTDAREVSELVGILKNAGMEEPRMMAIKALSSFLLKGNLNCKLHLIPSLIS